MATDTARVNLELASGRNAVTAPFQNTSQRRPKQQSQPTEQSAAPPPPLVEPPLAPLTIINVPLANPTPVVSVADPDVSRQPRQTRPTWVAFIGAVVVAAGAVWWVMSQRMPSIDPADIIQRNLADARAAMADGRYTDPSERSAFHYYSTVLALDPRNEDALTGLEEIADRHITNARVLLADKHIAEAGVALEKARRVRPNHTALPDLDALLRIELRKLLIANNTIPAPIPAAATPPAAKQTSIAPPRPAPVTTTPAPRFIRPTPAPAQTAALAPTPAHSEPKLQTPTLEEFGNAPMVPEPMETSHSASALPESKPTTPVVPTVELKLIKMVQPEYPQEAWIRGMEGWVDVSMEVNSAGDVVEPRIEGTSRGRMFNRAALNAIQQWKYEPREGASNDRVRVRLQFKLTK